MTEKEKMLAGKLYIIDDELKKDYKRARVLTRLFNATTEEQEEYRRQLISELFGAAGKNCSIVPPFRCDYGSHIYVGENFYANYDCIFLDVCEIRIGDNVMFGPRVCIYTAGHPIDADVRASGLEFGKPATIGDNVWIGGSSVILPGVTVGKNTVIGSGSVVTKDIPDNVIAMGNPCRPHRELTDEDKKYWENLKAEYEKNLNLE